MRFRFLHCADLHLGRQEQAGGERYEDYFRALGAVVHHAILERADAVLIAGDLFDTQVPSAETVRKAARALRPLREAGIAACAIEGNHDRRKRREPSCALDILAGEGYFDLLRPRFEDGSLVLDRHDRSTGTGSIVVPRPGVRIAGLGFSGHNAEGELAAAHSHLEGGEFTIVLLHAMIIDTEAQSDHGTCLYGDIAALRDRIGYLALGHRHTRIGLDTRYDGWVYNPGALEFVNPQDYRQAEDRRGFFDCTLTDEAGGPGLGGDGRHVVRRGSHMLGIRHIPVKKRPTVAVRVDVGGLSSPDAIVAHALDTIRATVPAEVLAGRPILLLRLTGALAIARMLLPRSGIADAVRETFGAVHADVADDELYSGSNDARLLLGEGAFDNVADRARAIAATLLREKKVMAERQDEFAAVLLELKERLKDAADSPPGALIEDALARLRSFVPTDGGLS